MNLLDGKAEVVVVGTFAIVNHATFLQFKRQSQLNDVKFGL